MSWLRRNATALESRTNSKEIFKELFNTYQETKAVKRNKNFYKAPPPKPPTKAEVFLSKLKVIIASNFWRRSLPAILSIIILFWIYKKRVKSNKMIQKTKFDVIFSYNVRN